MVSAYLGCPGKEEFKMGVSLIVHEIKQLTM